MLETQSRALKRRILA